MGTPATFRPDSSLSWGGGSVLCCRVFSFIPGQYPLDSSSKPLVRMVKMSKCSGRQNHPVPASGLWACVATSSRF